MSVSPTPCRPEYIIPAEVGDKKVLITALPQPEGLTAMLNGRRQNVHLANVMREANEVREAFGGPGKAELLSGISFAELDAGLSGREVWCFAGHGDAKLDGEPTLSFTKEGQLESVTVATIADTVRKHAQHGKLGLVVFTGCCTLKLAEALQEQAGVQHIVCWSTVLQDEAGRIFGAAFAHATAEGLAPRAAFEKAKENVGAKTEDGFGSDGLAMQVQRFELDIDPKDAARVVQDSAAARSEAGLVPQGGSSRWVPELGSKIGRLIEFHGRQQRGRQAVGVPVLLDRSARKDADIPAAAQKLLDDLDEGSGRGSRVRCNDDEKFKHVVARVVELIAPDVAPPRPIKLCLTGAEKVGKSVLAAEVVSSSRVRHYFREGRVLWMDATKSADELFPDAARELHRLLKAQWGDRTAPTQSDLETANKALGWIGCRLRAGTEGCMQCLLVLDGVTDGPAQNLASAAQSAGMHVLLTTRLVHMQEREVQVKPTWTESPQALFSGCASSHRGPRQRMHRLRQCAPLV